MSSDITTINLGGGSDQGTKPLISDDEIDKLINSQVKHPQPAPIPVTTFAATSTLRWPVA